MDATHDTAGSPADPPPDADVLVLRAPARLQVAAVGLLVLAAFAGAVSDTPGRLLAGALALAVAVGLVRLRAVPEVLRAGPDGLRVRPWWPAQDLTWAELAGITVSTSRRTRGIELDLADGGLVHLPDWLLERPAADVLSELRRRQRQARRAGPAAS